MTDEKTEQARKLAEEKGITTAAARLLLAEGEKPKEPEDQG